MKYKSVLIEKRNIILILACIILGLSVALSIFFYYASGIQLVKDRYPSINEAYYLNYNPLSPKIVAYQKFDNLCLIRVNFFELEKSTLVSWEIADRSFKEVITELDLNEQVKLNQCDSNLGILKEQVNRGELIKGDNINVQNIRQLDDAYIESQVDVPTKIEIIRLGEGKTQLKINNTVRQIQNAASPIASTGGRYVFYHKYELDSEDGDSHASYTGRIIRYDLQLDKGFEFFNFPQGATMALAANQKYLLYSLSTGEVGVIDLVSRVKKEILKLDMPEGADASTFQQVNDDFVIVRPNDKRNLWENNNYSLKIDLNTFNYKEI